MKLSLRLPFSFLILFAVFSIFSFRGALWGDDHDAGSPPLETAAHAVASSVGPTNATLLRLAAEEVAEPALRRDVEDLLEGNLPRSAASRGRGRSQAVASSRLHYYSQWARENHLDSDPRTRYSKRLPIRLRRRSPKDYHFFPEFSRALRDWFRGRRFQPEIMSELVGLVKRPIDRHYGLPDSGDRRYGSCAVVGNSGILLKNDHGYLIDSHDLVIRLNNARSHGYQRHVGAKTGLSFVNSNILHTCARRESCFCHPYGENVPLIMYICQAVHFLDYTVCNSSHKAPLLITDARFDLLCARIVKYYSLKLFVEKTGKSPEDWKKAHDEKNFHYSSGMQALMLALGICDQVSVFGFGKSAEAKHHYHTNQKSELGLHDYQAEYAFYHDLIVRPQVIPYLKDSKFKVPPIVFYH